MKWLSRILTVIVTMSMACGALIFNRRHQLKAKTLNFNHKALTIIIPARNEEKNRSFTTFDNTTASSSRCHCYE